MDDTGALKKIGDNYQILRFNPVKDRADISIKFDIIEITFKKLRYNDKFTFVCKGVGVDKNLLNIYTKNVTVAVQNVQGMSKCYFLTLYIYITLPNPRDGF